MTRRLLLSYLGLAVLILIVLEVPLGVLAQRHERDLSANQAAREAAGLAGLATEDLEHPEPAQLGTLVDTYRSSTGGEVAIVGRDGKPMAQSSGDTDNDLTGDARHLTALALNGASVSSFTSDEGAPWAEAATPISVDGAIGGAVLLAIPANGTVTRIHHIWLALAVFAAAVLVLTAGVGLVMARSLSQPLARLGSAVAGLGAGDLTVRASEDRGPPQIRSLAEQFNLMAARLEELVDAQARFVADASHQLRSPLTALRLRLENLEAASDDAASAAGLAAAGSEVLRLSRIVDGLLTLSRTGQDEPRREPVDLDEVIAGRCDAWADLAGEKGVTIVKVPGRRSSGFAPLVHGDLEQILDNLIANALDACPENSTITVSTEGHGGRGVQVHVRDEGPGMSAEHRRAAFNRFWRGSASSDGHSGLGLAIVRQLAARNGATVELRSAEPSGLDAVVTLRSVEGRRPGATER